MSLFSLLAHNLIYHICSVLLDISDNLKQVARPDRHWKRYLKSNMIRDDIARYRKQVEELRLNFMVRLLHVTMYYSILFFNCEFS
jgi:hypothetical protein